MGKELPLSHDEARDIYDGWQKRKSKGPVSPGCGAKFTYQGAYWTVLCSCSRDPGHPGDYHEDASVPVHWSVDAPAPATIEERPAAPEDALTEIERLRAEGRRLTAERDEAREWVRRLTREQRVLTCAFCGAEYPPGTPESNHAALTAHVRVCPKHPMREVERERDAALNRVGMSEEEAARVAHACFAFNVGANQQDAPPTYGLTDTLIAAFRAIAAGVRPPTEGGDWIEPLCEWWPGLAQRDTVATPMRRGLILRKATRGSVEIGVVLGPAKLTPEAVDVLIGWVTDPGVAGIATVRFSQIERGIWRVASAQDAALARVNLAVPERDHRGRILTAVDAVVLTEPLGPPLSPSIALPWNEEAQRIVDTAPEDET